MFQKYRSATIALGSFMAGLVACLSQDFAAARVVNQSGNYRIPTARSAPMRAVRSPQRQMVPRLAPTQRGISRPPQMTRVPMQRPVIVNPAPPNSSPRNTFTSMPRAANINRGAPSVNGAAPKSSSQSTSNNRTASTTPTYSLPIPAPAYNGHAKNGFNSPSYAKDQQKQHLGSDLKVNGGTPVYAPVNGKVVWVKQSSDPMQSAVIIQQAGSKTQFVLGHISSNVKMGDTVTSGQPVGSVMNWKTNAGDNSHLHFGKNVDGKAVPTDNAWGWGRAPASSTPEQLRQHGWVEPGL